MNQLIEWNNIKNNFVYPGQQLVVSKGSSSASGSTSNTSTGNTSSNTANTGSTTSGSTYTVKAGESVWSVSNKFGISMNQLIQWNNIKNNFIYPGQKLIVKGGSSSSNASTSTANNKNTASSNTSSTATGQATYTVKAGESEWGVANKNGISMNQLIEWNNIKNNFIYPGQKLIVKGGSSKASATATTKPTASTPASTTPTASSTGDTKYTVKAGESVWGVANKHHITMDQLIEWNNIKNNFIYPGQEVIVKKGTAQSTPAKSDEKTYTVKAGESVWGVADSHGITMNQLIEWNNIKNNFIYPGQQLIVKK